MTAMRKLLIIDDNPAIVALFTAELEDEYEVLTAENGMSGVQTALSALPDIILLDINMPDLSGLEVLRYLERYDATRAIPVVIITASDYNSTSESLAKTSKNLKGFISKLVSGDELRATLRGVLEKED